MWQKYSILEPDLIDRLNRISSNAKIESVISQSNTDYMNSNENLEKLKRLQYLQERLLKQQLESERDQNTAKLDNRLIAEIHKLTAELLTKSGAEVRRPLTPPLTTKKEIHKVPAF